VAGALLTVRFNLQTSCDALAESVRLIEEHAGEPSFEEAYRQALRARNGLFHARRAWCDLMSVGQPQMPVTGVAGGRRDGHQKAAQALREAIAAMEPAAVAGTSGNDVTAAGERAGACMTAAEDGFREYLGYLKDEVGRRLSLTRGR